MKRIIPFLFITALFCMAIQCDPNCTQCENEKTELQKQITALSQQLQDCQTVQVANQAKIDDLTYQLETCNSESQADKAKIILLTQQLQDCQSNNCNECAEQLAQCQQSDALHQANIAELTTMLNECNSENDIYKARIVELTNQLIALNQQIAVLNDSIIILNDSIKKLNQGAGSDQLWDYSYVLPNDSTVFNFWSSSEVSAPYQTKTSAGTLEFDQYTKIKGYERMFNKAVHPLYAGDAYFDIILYDSTFQKVLFNGQFDISDMLPKTEYNFQWNTGDFTLPYLGKYYLSKVFYEKLPYRDRPLEGSYITFTTTDDVHTMLKMKTYPVTPIAGTIPNLKVYINADTTYFPVSIEKVDSTYIVYLNYGFGQIKSLTFKTDVDLILKEALLSSVNLLNNPTIQVKGLTLINGVYEILNDTMPIPPADPLVARWRFEQNGNDEKGIYTAILSHPEYMYENTYKIEGNYYLSANNSDCYANAGIVPLGDEFSISLYFRTPNSNSDSRSILGNTRILYPDGFVLYMDEIAKSLKFATSDGTDAHRMFIMTNDAVWTTSTWCHVIIAASRVTGIGKMYINGVDQTRPTSTGIFKTFKTTTNFIIGKTPEGQMWGYIDDVRVYNKILTAQEAQKLYSTGGL